MNLKIKLSIALVMSLMLVACGGGGGSTPPKKVFNLVKEEIILDNSSSVKLIVNTYDDKGVLVRQDRDFDGNGEIDGRETYYTYTYDEKGQLQIREKHASTGNVIIIEEYDEHGNRVSISNDTDRDGEFDFFLDYINTYDDTGLLLKVESIKRVLSYTYDENIVITSFDFDPIDGMPNVITAETYNEHGDLIKYQRDSNGDGEYDSSGNIFAYTYTFDNNNNIVKKEEDRNDDGSVNKITVYTWEEFK